MTPALLESDLDRIRRAALKAVIPEKAIERTLWIDHANDQIHSGDAVWDLADIDRIVVLAIGKASIAMASAACRILDGLPLGGIVVTRHGQAGGVAFPQSIQIFETGHPVPDAAGVAAAEAVAHVLSTVSQRDRVLVLLSGGASALLCSPAIGVTLDDLQQLTTLLLRSGATIGELNTIRKHVERLKGGHLAQLAHPATLSALILSDVVGDPLAVIASGPTVPDPTTWQDCWHILQRYDLIDALPASISTLIQRGLSGDLSETPKPGDPVFSDVHNQVIGSNLLAAQAAVAEAQQAGYATLLLTTFMEGEAREVGKMAAALARGIRTQQIPLSPPACVVWGGETTVTVRGNGKGGRNQELALSAALSIDGLENAAILAFATDGIDGPTDAAGAIVSGQTIAHARQLGLDPQQALANNDSYALLNAVGSLIITGATGTNVNDLVVLLVESRTSL